MCALITNERAGFTTLMPSAIVRRVSYCLTAVILVSSLGIAAEFAPEYEGAKLRGVNDVEFTRVGITRNWRTFETIGNWQVAVEDGMLLVSPSDKDEPPRQITSVDGRKLRLLGGTDGIALVAVENSQEDIRIGRHYVAAEIRRLDLASLEWLPAWKIEPQAGPSREAAEPTAHHRRVSVLGKILVDHDRVIVLSYTMGERSQWPEGLTQAEIDAIPTERQKELRTSVYQDPVSYEATCFVLSAPVPTWSKSFPWIEDDDVPAALTEGVWSFRETPPELLTWLGNSNDKSVLVCAGQKQVLACLLAADGQELWSIPRIWEYERGYIGPSVFEYFVERFGLDYATVQSAEQSEEPTDPNERKYRLRARRELEQATKRFDRDYEGWIAAGPVIVPGEIGAHVFIATARRRKGNLGSGHEPPEQCTIYEIEGDSGEFLAATSLPRMVQGRPFKTSPGALIWSCDRGCLVRLHHSEFDFSRGFAGSNNDALCRIAWYREYGLRVPPSWFWADPPHGVAAFDEKRLFRAAAAYVIKEGDMTYQFKIQVVELETGLDQDYVLSVPFHGDFPMPEHGYAAVPGSTHATQPHVLRIASLSVDGDRLRIVMDRCETNSESVALDFNIGDRN